MAAGKFITLEGGEGAGKSTQAARLAAFLEGLGKTVLLTREPGGTPLAERIRELLFHEDGASRGPLIEALLFNAARADHLAGKIRPALEEGTWVVCDRFLDSTRAYQGAAGTLSRSAIDGLEDLVVRTTRPNLTILCDIDPKLGLSRAEQRRQTDASRPGGGDPFERRGMDFHDRLRIAFLDAAAAEPHRIAVVDASGDPDRVAREIIEAVTDRLLAESR